MESEYSLNIYPSACQDIEDIIQYISKDLSNPMASNNLIEELQDAFERILVFPKMYPLIDNQFVGDPNLRKIIVKNYLVFYRLKGKEIQVIRVIHSKSDYQTLLM